MPVLQLEIGCRDLPRIERRDERERICVGDPPNPARWLSGRWHGDDFAPRDLLAESSDRVGDRPGSLPLGFAVVTAGQ